MAKFASLVALAILVCASFNICRARGYEFTVGDGQGWREPEGNDTSVYTRWAAKIRFQIGDSVRFRYENDSVLVVEKKDYYHCNTSSPIAAFTDGSTAVKLDRSGPIYFISGALDHCKNGQRLIIDVLGAPRPQPSPADPSSPPSPAMPLPPSPAPATSSAVSLSISAVSLGMVVAWGALSGLLLR